MPKKKRQGPRKTKEQILQSVKKQRQSAFDRALREIDHAMSDLRSITARLKDTLQPFKRLGGTNREKLYDYIERTMKDLDSTVDDYYDALPASMREAEANEPSLYRETIGEIGMALGIASFFGSLKPGLRSDDEFKSPEFDPDVIDITPEKPKQLKGKE